LAASCGGGSGAGTNNGGSGGGSGGSGTSQSIQHVAIVVFENQDYLDVIGSGAMPYLNGLVQQLALRYSFSFHCYASGNRPFAGGPDRLPGILADAIEKGALATKSICRTFSDCTTAPRNGMISGCYPLDKYYSSKPEFQKLKEIKKATGA